MWQSRFFKPFLLMFPLALAFLISPNAPVTGQQKPEPPKTGTPGGNPRPGTTRPALNCPRTQTPLTAIVANNGSDFTSSAQPTLWFYVPYRPAQISHLEFLLLDGSERKTIYRTLIQMTHQSGIVKVTMPAQSEYALALNQNYRWRLNLDCAPDTTVEPDLMVEGWIRRIAVDARSNPKSDAPLQQYSTYVKAGLWYDAINHLAEHYFANPEDTRLRAAWTELLKDLGFAEVSASPLARFDLVRLEN